MFRDITIGQYYPTNSVIHRLDPRTKLIGTFLYLASLFIVDGIVGYLVAGAALFFTVRQSHVPFTFLLRGLKAIFLILIISVSFNIFLTPGKIVFSIGPLRATFEGLRIAAFMGVRLILLVMGSSLMTLTTTPNALTDGLESVLGFLNRFNVPVHEIAMMMAIALRFIPILTEELDRIVKAQLARGADFSSGNIIRRGKALVPVLIPLFVSAFRRASDLANAMEARCYHGGEGRTRMRPLRYERCDRVAYAILSLYFAGMIVMAVLL